MFVMLFTDKEKLDLDNKWTCDKVCIKNVKYNQIKK